MESRYPCMLLASRPFFFDSEAALSQAFFSQAFSRRTGRGREWSPWMLDSVWDRPDQKPVKLVSFPDVPVGFPGELTTESVLFFQPDPERQS